MNGFRDPHRRQGASRLRAADGSDARLSEAAVADIDTPERPLTPRGRRTRSALVSAARAVFERDGFVGARVTDIAAHAGVAHGTFYTYFDSKEAVFRDVIA